MSHPACDGTGIVLLGSVTTPGQYSEGVQRLLDAGPGASYLRTDQSCPSLRQATADGNAIYAVYRVAGRSETAICDAVSAPGGTATANGWTQPMPLITLSDAMTDQALYRDVMNAPGSDGHRREFVSRRRLLQVAGGAGLAALVSACTSPVRPHSVTEPTVGMSPSLAVTTGPKSSTIASPPREPMTVPAPVSSVPSGVLLCREAWGARSPRPGGTPQIPRRLTIHHTAVFLGDNSNAPGRIREDQRYHQDSQGWIDIAYHIGVDRNGNIYELRNPELVGDTATSYDPTGHFLIVCEGNFDEEDVTEELLNGVTLACAWAAHRFFISPDTLAGHRDFAATSCPGTNLYAHIASGEIKRRTEDLVASGAGSLQQACGPEAAARVAAIEAGN